MRAHLSCVAVLLLLAGACGPIPQPFRPPEDAKTDNAFLMAAGVAGVAVRRIDGPVAWVGETLARAVAAALRERGVAAGAGPANRKALQLSASGHRQAGAGPAELVINWTLSKPDGALLKRRQTRFTPPDSFWNTPTPALFRDVARDIAARTADWILDDGRRPRVAVTTVEGATRDGDRALRRALTAALSDHRIAPAAIGEAGFLVLPDIAVSRAGRDGERIRMRWIVITPDGTEIGRVDQENTIAAGRLARDWPGVGAAIANAAAADIVRLVRAWRAAAGQSPQ